jgi:hypothetical protein
VASPEKPLTMSEEEEIALAIELSERAEREYAESLISQDEALARVLEESLLDSETRPGHPALQLTDDGEHVHPSSKGSWAEHPYSPRQASPPPIPVRRDSTTPLVPPADAQLQADDSPSGRSEAEYERGRTTPTRRPNNNADSRLSDILPRYADIVGTGNGTWINKVISMSHDRASPPSVATS